MGDGVNLAADPAIACVKADWYVTSIPGHGGFRVTCRSYTTR